MKLEQMLKLSEAELRSLAQFEKVYLKPEVDALQAEVQRLNNEKYELLDELREIRNHLQAIKDFINGSDNGS